MTDDVFLLWREELERDMEPLAGGVPVTEMAGVPLVAAVGLFGANSGFYNKKNNQLIPHRFE